MSGAKSRRQRQAVGKGGCDESHHQSGYGSQKEPAQILADVVCDGFSVMHDRFLQCFHNDCFSFV